MKLTREDWLLHGLAQLSTSGAAGLRLAALCASLGKTRGSFYHHFEDQDGFVRQMVELWAETTADSALDMLEIEAEITDSAVRPSQIAATMDPDLENALRRFAKTSAPAADGLAAIDARRIQMIGAGGDRAAIAYAALVGALTLWPGAPVGEFAAKIDEMIAAG